MTVGQIIVGASFVLAVLVLTSALIGVMFSQWHLRGNFLAWHEVGYAWLVLNGFMAVFSAATFAGGKLIASLLR